MTIEDIKKINSIRDFDRIIGSHLFHKKKLRGPYSAYMLGRIMGHVVCEQLYQLKIFAASGSPQDAQVIYDPAIRFCEAVRHWYKFNNDYATFGSPGYDEILLSMVGHRGFGRTADNLRKYLFRNYNDPRTPYEFYKEMLDGFSAMSLPHVKLALIHDELNLDLDKFGYATLR